LNHDATANPATPVAVTFARPEESHAFRQMLDGAQKGRCGELTAWRGTLGGNRITVIHTGIGPASATAAMHELLKCEKPRRVISAGFAGGLDPALRPGDTLAVEFPTRLILSKADPLETPAEKVAAFRETGARIVDMESDVIGASCAAAGIPLTSVRAVSDPADESLPVPFGVWFDTRRQCARPIALVWHLLRHPAHIAPFARFVLRLPRVARALAQAIGAALR